MKKIMYILMGWGMAMLLALPAQAQDVVEEDSVEQQDEAADSVAVDSLVADTYELPWPESVRGGIDKLLKGKCLRLPRWVS